MTKSKNKTVKHEGVTYLQNGKWAIRCYTQNVDGTANVKVVKHLLAMTDNGERNIIINVYTNQERIFKSYVREIEFVKKFLPAGTHVEVHHLDSNEE